MSPIIDRTYEVILPSGRYGRVNVFELNLILAANPKQCVQLQDGSWITARGLTIKRQFND